MNKKIKFNVKKIIMFSCIGTFIFLLGVKAGSGYSSDEIYYGTTGKSVTSALNELYPIKNELTSLKSQGDALNTNILTGTSAVVQGKLVNGTMTDRGAVSSNLNAGGSYTVPAGYHNGSGKITANSLSSQTSADAVAANILINKTAWVNGSKITGTMTDRGTWTSTPSSSGNVTIPAGYHNGSGYVNTSSVYNAGVAAGKASATVATQTIVKNYNYSNEWDIDMDFSFSNGVDGIKKVTYTSNNWDMFFYVISLSGNHAKIHVKSAYTSDTPSKYPVTIVGVGH